MGSVSSSSNPPAKGAAADLPGGKPTYACKWLVGLRIPVCCETAAAALCCHALSTFSNMPLVTRPLLLWVISYHWA